MDEIPEQGAPVEDIQVVAAPTKKAAAKKVASKGGTKAAKQAKPPAAPWTFPKNTLEDAIKIARALEEQNAGSPRSEQASSIHNCAA